MFNPKTQSIMKILSLNHEANAFEVFYITDEYAKWCIDNNVDDYEFNDASCFNDFVTDFFRDLGYDNPEFKTFCACDDDEKVRVIEAYPDEHIIELVN